MIKFCRANCKELNLKEKEQDEKKEPHVCMSLNKRLYHGPFHPRLVKFDECNK